MKSSLSIKRISKEIKELYENPIEGIGIISLDNDITKYIVNMKLLTGPYKNYCLQLLLTFSDNYPIKPPKILIYPNQLFDNLYHHHVFNDEKTLDENGKSFKKLCIDLLDNDFMSTKEENTGWNPSYTISTLLMQVQIFLSNPDLSENSMPKPYQIDELMQSMNKYERIFTIKENGNEIIKMHTWKDPYPKMYFKENNEINKSLISLDKNKIIKENLTCFITKLNIFDDTNIIFGYPLVKKSEIIYPIAEVLSYEGYLTQLSNEESNKSFNRLKSANNKYYDKWLPIYLNNDNFEKNKQTILNSFSVIKYGLSGEKNYDFKPEYISEIMFKLIYRMINDIKDKNFSSSYIRAFFQYILLYKKLSNIYPINIDKYFNYDFIIRNDISYIIGDLMVSSLFDKIDTFEKSLLFLRETLKNNLAFQFFVKKEDCNLKSPYEFLEYLENNNLLNKMFDAMKFERNLFLYNGKKLKNKIKNIILNSFKEFIVYSDDNTRERLKKIILNNIKFYNYVDINKYLKTKLESDEDIKQKNKIKNINDNFILSLFIKKIIEEKNFINKIENSYGVYIEIDEIITKLNEVINDNEIEIQDKKVFDDISNNIIKELFLLDKNSEIKLKEDESFLFEKINYFDLGLSDFFFGDFFLNRRYINLDISDYKKILNYFYDIENLEFEDLKLIYLYCFERMKKNINPNNNDLTVIESMYYKCSLNNDNENDEWYNYISKRQLYNNLNREKKDKLKLSQFQTIKLFRYAINLNKELLSKIDKEDIDLNKLVNNIFELNQYEENEYDFFMKAIIKNIVKFAGYIKGKEFKLNNAEDKNDNNSFRHLYIRITLNRDNYYVEKDESLISKLKDIYELEDITLLTFYEFIWFEEKYDICHGFLSSLANNNLYELRMKKHILKIKNEMQPKIKRKYKKEKIYKKKADNILLKLIKKNDIHSKPKKSGLWKIRIPLKSKKKNNHK